MKRVCICEIGTDLAGEPQEVSPFNDAPESCIKYNHYWEKEPDPNHPSPSIKVCGNCMHFTVVEGVDTPEATPHQDNHP